MQVRELDEIAIDQANKSDAGPNDLVCSYRTQCAKADKKHARSGQPLLPCFADRSESDLTGIPFIQRQALPSPAGWGWRS